MATSNETLDFVMEQIAGAGDVSARKMFGEVGIYCDGKFCALICDDEFYVKPTAQGRAFAPTLTEASPYPGAKPHPHVSGDLLEDREWAATLVRLTAADLPQPKPKTKAKPKAKPAAKKAPSKKA